MALKRVGDKKRVARGPLAKLLRAALYVVVALFLGWVFIAIRHAPPLWYLLENNQDRQIFYAAFQPCDEEAIATKRYTVEGDPIYSYAEILGRGQRGCRMRIKVDYSADRFGDATLLNVDTYCYSLKMDSNSDYGSPDVLVASNCEDIPRRQVRL